VTGVRRTLRDNGLGLVFGLLFFAMLVGQAVSGLAQYNDQQIAIGAEPVSLGHYLTSSSFAVDVVENWQSEYLQFFLYIFGTIWLVQRGSSESRRSTGPASSPTPTSSSARTPAATRRAGFGPATGAPRCSPARSAS
jgi:hypothetical protein